MEALLPHNNSVPLLHVNGLWCRYCRSSQYARHVVTCYRKLNVMPGRLRWSQVVQGPHRIFSINLLITLTAQSRSWVLAAWLLGSRVRIPLKSWMFYPVCLCCDVRYRQRTCEGLITHAESPSKCKAELFQK